MERHASNDSMLSHEAELSERPAPPPSETVLRFCKAERQVHWAIAIPFLVCYSTSLILVNIRNPESQALLRPAVSWIHRISGVCLALLPPLVMLMSGKDWRLHLHNVRQAWLWTLTDVSWLFRMGISAAGLKISLPEQGKFNAGEKLNFMLVMTSYPIFILTGIIIWLPGAALYSWLIHYFLALLATPFLLGHIFMATLNPDTRAGLHGMISGFVDRRWAKHHYPVWYRETYENGDVPPEDPLLALPPEERRKAAERAEEEAAQRHLTPEAREALAAARDLYGDIPDRPIAPRREE